MKKGLQVWLNFLDSYNGVSVMLDHFWTSNEALEFYSDRAGGTGSQKGFGIYFQGKWAQGSWALDWAKKCYSLGYYDFRTLPSCRCYSAMGGPVEKQKGVVSYRQSVCCYHSKQTIRRQNHAGS